MARGHVYVVAIMDWHSRQVLAWRLSNTLDASFCVDALHEALSRFGTPTIFNSDQGSQFTSVAFLQVLRDRDIQISMDGQGCWRDNVMIERMWRSLKYECALLHAFQNPHEARQHIGAWFEFYNDKRRHQALGDHTPAVVYENDLEKVKYAARDDSSRKFDHPDGVVKGAPIQLKLLNKLSHGTTPPVIDSL